MTDHLIWIYYRRKQYQEHLSDEQLSEDGPFSVDPLPQNPSLPLCRWLLALFQISNIGMCCVWVLVQFILDEVEREGCDKTTSAVVCYEGKQT